MADAHYAHRRGLVPLCPRDPICSPIWVFALAAPVRSFCMEAAGKIKEADYILVHHQNSVYENTAEEMDELLGITHTALRSLRCREGTYKCIKGEKR